MSEHNLNNANSEQYKLPTENNLIEENKNFCEEQKHQKLKSFI